jgi:UDP-N-acetyl-D-mannosaminuronate dehydrogenase
MAASLDDTLKDCDAIILLVRHTEFVNLKPADISAATRARLIFDTVNGWNANEWRTAGFQVARLGVGK